MTDATALSVDADWEQHAALLRDVATAAGQFFSRLIECGIPHDLACQMVAHWHASLLEDDATE